MKGSLAEGDLVQPSSPLMGTWRAAAVFRAKSLQRIGCLGDTWLDAAVGGGAAASAMCREAAALAAAAGGAGGGAGAGGGKGRQGGGVEQEPSVQLPLEYLACSRELLAAYRLLEMHDLKVG